MTDSKVITSQPVPSAPMEEPLLAESSALAKESTVVLQPNTEKVDVLLNRAEAKDEGEERRRRRNSDFCCFACADSFDTNDDVFCWYFLCRLYCQCLGHVCQGISDCTESCCEGCGECLKGCCDCCADGGGADGAGHDGCCHDCCCDDGCCDDGCDCGDCDCGDCDCSCLN